MKVLISLIAVVFMLGMVGIAEASIISFADTLVGVDSPGAWATGDTVVGPLSNSYSLLGGDATVTGYTNSSSSALSHRLTRGLGVWGGRGTGGTPQDDEIDGYTSPHTERIEITFDVIDYYVSSLEIRSLFDPDLNWAPGLEVGVIDFWLDGSKFYTETLFGGEPEMADGSNDGDVVLSYMSPMIVDKLVFYIPSAVPLSYPGYGGMNDGDKAWILGQSDFAVAKLDVKATPEPATMLLLGSGLLALAAFGWRKKLTS